MAKIDIPESLRDHLGPEMQMDVHWVDIRLKDGRSFDNLVVRGGRYLTGTADAPGGESTLAFEASDIATLRRHRVWSRSFLWAMVLMALAGLVSVLVSVAGGK